MLQAFRKNYGASNVNKPRLQNLFLQKLIFENEKKIKAKFEFVKNKNKYDKMEQDVVKSIVKNEKILLRKKFSMRNRYLKVQKKLKKMKIPTKKLMMSLIMKIY